MTDIFTLSPQQQRLWKLGAMEGGPFRVGVVAALDHADATSVWKAAEAAVGRHKILRTYIRPGSGSAKQEVRTEAPVAFSVSVSCTGTIDNTADQLIDEVFAESSQTAPLSIRAAQASCGKWVVAIAQAAWHTDPTGLLLLCHELASGGGDSGDHELGTQYPDLAEWQHQILVAPDTSSGRASWRPLDVPTTQWHPSWSGSTSIGPFRHLHHWRRVLDSSLVDRLCTAAAGTGGDTAVWLLAAWQALVDRLQMSDGTVIGVLLNGRSYPELGQALGPLSRYIPLTTAHTPEATLASRAGLIAQTLPDMGRRQYFFELERVAGAFSPVPFIPIVFEQFDLDSAACEGWQMLRVRGHVDRFELKLSVERSSRGIAIELHTIAEAMTPNDLAILGERYLALLAGALREDHVPIRLVDAILPYEPHRCGPQIGASTTDEPYLCEAFAKAAARHATCPAIISGETIVTYGVLDDWANAIAARLIEQGLELEEPVAILIDRSPVLIAAILGVLKSGGAYVPLDPALSPPRLARMIDAAGAKRLLTTDKLASRVPARLHSTLLAPDPVANSAPQNLPAPNPLQLAYIILTSGSTGVPKAVMIPHAAINNYVGWSRRNYIGTSGRGALILGSIAFDLSLTSLFLPLMEGEPVVLVPQVDEMQEAAKLLVNVRWRLLKLTPSHLRVLKELVLSDQLREAVDVIVLGGETLLREDVAPLLGPSGPVVVNEYGPTEATVGCSVHFVSPATLDAAPMPIGRPIAGAALYVLDSDLMPRPPSIIGEIYIAGVGLARGYVHDAPATAAAFVPDPQSLTPGERMYRTGDLGRLCEDGTLEFVGRADTQVKIRGHRVELAEVEAALRSDTRLREAAVVAPANPRGDRRLVAFVVPREGEDPAAADIIDLLAAELPEAMLPVAVRHLQTLPVGRSGKLDRRQLEELASQPQHQTKAVTPNEELLYTIWCDLLDQDTISIDDDFFALGGDSIRSLQLIARAHSCGMTISLQQVMEQRTIRHLAATVQPGAEPRQRVAPFVLVPKEDQDRIYGLEDAYPLTALQEGMVFHRELDPGASIYHDVISYHLRGPIELKEMRGEVEALFARHPALRTSFDLSASHPLQLVHPTVPDPFETHDLRGASDRLQKEAIENFIAAELGRGFDVSVPPLVRIAVHLRSAETFQFTMSFHHAVLDGWSDAVLVTELARGYLDRLRGTPRTYGPMATSFADFVSFEREIAQSSEARKFWVERLSGRPFLRLPRWNWLPAKSSRQRTAAMREVEISLEVSHRLEELARETHAPLKSVLLAIHVKALGLVAGEQVVTTCATSSGRLPVRDGDRVAGLFLNSTPVVVDLEGGSWADLVARVQAGERDALPYAAFPIALVKQGINDTAISDTTFYFTHYHVYEELAHYPEFAVLESFAHETTSFTFVASFRFDVEERRVRLILAYDPNELPNEEITAIAMTYGQVAQAMAEQHIKPGDLVATACAAPPVRMPDTIDANTTLGMLFDAAAAGYPDAVALSCDDARLTYSELAKRANQLAHFLTCLGTRPEDRIGLALPPGINLVVAILAVLKAGAAYVPLHGDEPAERARHILRDAGCRLVLMDGQSSLMPEDIADFHVVDLDRESTAIDAGPDAALLGEIDASNLAYIIYTSGTTGHPKGVLVTHSNVIRLFTATSHVVKARPKDCWLLFHSASFDFSVWELWGALLHGGRLVVPPRRPSSDVIADVIRQNGISILNLTPSGFGMMLSEWEEFPEDALGLVRLICLGGEPIDPSALSRWFERFSSTGIQLINMYGITETSVHATTHLLEVADGMRGYGTRIGRPLPDLTVRILDREGREVPIGVAGELYVGGSGLARGYSAAALTADRFVPDSYSARPGDRLYRSGDRACRLPDGSLLHLGRIDRQVKIRGHRIEPAEIEAAMRSVPGVASAAVHPVPSNDGTSTLVAFYERRRNTSSDAARVRSALAAKIPYYMMPSHLEEVDVLPRTAGGKIDYGALARSPPPLRSEGQSEDWSTATEEIVGSIWVDLLQAESIGAEDSFFALGGHSILAMRAIARLRRTFVLDLPLKLLFEHPTVRQFAAVVDRLRGQCNPPIDSLPQLVPDSQHQSEPFPLTSIQEAYWIGREEGLLLGNQAAHAYLEFEARDLDLERLENAFDKLIRRHGMLRAIVLPTGEQQILTDVPLYKIAVVDVTGALEADQQYALETARNEMAEQRFACERWPLFEVRATRMSVRNYRLHLSIDLLITDADSLAILGRDIEHFYEDPSAPAVPPGLSFRDYVLAEKALRGSRLYAASREYWINKLPFLRPAPELAITVPLGTLKKPSFSRLSGRVETDTWRALKLRGAQAGLTPSAFLLSVYASMLAVWSRSQRFTVNLTTYNCLLVHPDVDELVGDFTCLTLVGVDLEQPNFLAAARSIQTRLLDDLDHSYFNGIEVMREKARRTGGHEPMPVVFTSTLPLHTRHERKNSPILGTLVLGITQSPQTLLDHQVSEEDGALTFRWDYVAEAFRPETIEGMFADYCDRLSDLARDPMAWTSASFLSSGLPTALLAANQSTTLHGFVLRQARQTPKATAVIAADRTLTYAELCLEAMALAHRLAAAGIRREELIAVALDKGWRQTVAVLGILLAGGAYLPVDLGQPRARMAAIVELGEVRFGIGERSADQWAPSVAWFHLDAGANDVGASDSWPEDTAALAYVVFTSGTTGRPKGVMIEHAAAVNTILDINRRFDLGSADRILAISSLAFDLSVFDLFGPLFVGGAVVYPDHDRDPQSWWRTIERHGVTVWNSAPAAIDLLLEWGEAPADVCPLRLVLLSGDWIPLSLPDKIRQFARVEIVSLGGATEAAIWSILHRIDGIDPEWRSIPYGLPMDGQDVQVLNERLEPCPRWVVGMIHIRGAGLARGYWHDPAGTAASFLPDAIGGRIYRTGDLGRYRANGEIEILGREDSQIKIDGHRIELGEIEALLNRHSRVENAVVAVVEGNGSRRLVAYVVGNFAAEPRLTPTRTPLSQAPRRASDIQLPSITQEDAAEHQVRRSHRQFLQNPLTLETIGKFLAPLAQLGGTGEPRRRYASASGLYAVSTYIWIAQGAVASAATGIYRYDPGNHTLVPVALGAVLPDTIHWPTNRPAFLGSALSVLLVGALDPVRLVYSDAARDFCLIEAGLMTQLLEESAIEVGLGVCQIGGIDFESLRPLFDIDLDDVCLHSLLVGPISAASPTNTLPVPAIIDRAGSERQQVVLLDGPVAHDLRSHLADRLPPYMMPSCFVWMPGLPLSANGKIDRRSLPRVPMSLALDAQESLSPAADAMVEAITRAIARQLSVHDIDASANFFELGANSLALVRAHREIRDRLGIAFPIVDMFRSPSAKSLARHLSSIESLPHETSSRVAARVTQRERRRHSKESKPS